MTSDRSDLPEEVHRLIGSTRTTTEVVTARDIRHFAQAIGEAEPGRDGNRSDRVVAPPLFPQVFAFADLPVEEMPADLSPIEADVPVPADRTVGGSSSYTFHAPVHPGDTITRTSELTGVVKRAGRSGDLHLVTVVTTFVNQDGVTVAREEATYVKR
jgi:3-methylfumaryl-CoA hydratase